jgi:hypothetical protein
MLRRSPSRDRWGFVVSHWRDNRMDRGTPSAALLVEGMVELMERYYQDIVGLLF